MARSQSRIRHVPATNVGTEDLSQLTEAELEQRLDRARAEENEAYQLFACASAANRSGAYVRRFCSATDQIHKIKTELDRRRNPEAYANGTPASLMETQYRCREVRERLRKDAEKDHQMELFQAYELAGKTPLRFFRIRTVEEAMADLIEQVKKENNHAQI